MKKIKLFLILIIALFGFGSIAVGCTTTNVEIPEGYVQVFIHYDGGKSENQGYAIYSIPEGARMPSGASAIAQPSRSGFDFLTWKKVVIKGANGGTPTQEEIDAAYEQVYQVKNHSGTSASWTFKYELEDFNFNFDRVDENTLLLAQWEPARYYVILTDETRDDDVDAEGYENNFMFKLNSYGYIPQIMGYQIPTVDGYQIEGYYTDRACRNEITTFPFYPEEETITDEDGNLVKYKVTKIYTKWIDATYTIVREYGDISNITETGRYYLKNDIDFEGRVLKTPQRFSGEIKGNGFKLSNVSVVIDQGRSGNTYGALFNSLEDAQINYFNVENVNIIFRKIDPSNISEGGRVGRLYLFASSVTPGTYLRDVKITGTVRVREYLRSSLALQELTDEDGNILYKLDESGQPIQKKYSNGEGVYEIDSEGNYVLDSNGERIPVYEVQGYKQMIGADGAPLTDGDGNPVYEIKKDQNGRNIVVYEFDVCERNSITVYQTTDLLEGLSASITPVASSINVEIVD